MNLSLLNELIYIKSIPINSENEPLIREKIQSLFSKTLNEQKNCCSASENYYRKAVITGCRSIIKDIKNFKLLSGENCHKTKNDIFSLLRTAAASCTFLLSPSVCVSAKIPEEAQLEVMCCPDEILWCVLCMIDSAASFTENGKIELTAWKIQRGASIKVSGSLISSLYDFPYQSVLSEKVTALCRKTAMLHSGQFFSVYEQCRFSIGFTISSKKTEMPSEEFSVYHKTAYDLISDRLSPLYAALSDTAPCFL